MATQTQQTTGLPPTMEWVGAEDGYLRLLDQTQLPLDVTFVDCTTAEQVWEAIKVLRVRGAPAIGVAAAYGVCLGTRAQRAAAPAEFERALDDTAAYLKGARPTAVNLAWAVDRIVGVARDALAADASDPWERILAEAHAMLAEDVEVCRRIGEAGESLIEDGIGVLTHCNAGALATTAHGTALSLMYAAHARGRQFRVFADETRPLLQGARLTAFELAAAGVDVTVICDNMAASLMQAGRVQMVVTGADRIAANGDTANKIGTYGLAVLARHHGIPFYVAAPRSTFDLSLASGAEIPIEQRDEGEVRAGFGRETVAPQAAVFNPAFDVTPAALITGIVTENGLLKPVSEERIRGFFA